MSIWIRLGAIAAGFVIAVHFAVSGMWLEALVMLGLSIATAISPNKPRWAR